VTEADVIAHWQRRARESLALARKAHGEGYYAHALFHCHLAVEKALKASIMAELQSDPPPTHDLLQLALRLNPAWTDEQKRTLAQLTQYAIAARYDDPPWAEREATERNSATWIDRSTNLLHNLLP
jgi:HEPN domain-containing protein